MAATVHERIDSWPEPQRTAARRIRDIIVNLEIGLEEGLKWNWPTYFEESNVCSIMCHKDHINLQFFRGAELDDPENILEGTGKSMRHIKIYHPDEVNSEIIRLYLKEAAGLS